MKSLPALLAKTSIGQKYMYAQTRLSALGVGVEVKVKVHDSRRARLVSEMFTSSFVSSSFRASTFFSSVYHGIHSS